MGHIIPPKVEQKKIEWLPLTKFSSKDAHCQHQILEALTTQVFLNSYFLSPQTKPENTDKFKEQFLARAHHARLPQEFCFFAFTTFTISPKNRR